VATGTKAEKDSPAFESQAYRNMAGDLEVVRDVAVGTRHIRSKRTDYLPKHPKETIPNYNNRLKWAVLFNALSRTVEGLTGMVFRRDPVISEDTPEKIEEHLQNIDNAGTHIDVFANQVLSDALEAGHAAILVDVPDVSDNVPVGRRATIREEGALGVRPYWVHVRKEDIFSPRTVNVRGQVVLQQVALREITMEPDGQFGEKEVTRYRVLSRLEETDNANGTAVTIRWELLEIVDDKVVSRGAGVVTNQTEIPLVPVYGKKTGIFQSQPPLLDLAETNLAHYRLLSDHLYAMHKVNLPVGVVTGADPDEEIEIGPNTFLKLPQGATFKFEQPSGSSFSDNREQLREFKQDMAAMGLSMLQVETRAAETAEAKRMDKSEQDSALGTAARSLQDALKQALVFHGNFLKIDKPGSIQINRDFEDLRLTPEEVTAYSMMHANGQISLETMWASLKEGGRLPDNFDPEVERERIENEGLPGPELEAAA